MKTLPSVFDCAIVTLPKIKAEAGHITAVNNGGELPFDVKRVFYLYDVPAGESRGAHAHKICHQFIVALSGAFEVLLDDGRVQRTVQLNRSHYGLYLPPGIWAAEANFAGGSVCLVLASHEYDAEDYLRDYDAFLTWRNQVSTSTRSGSE
jgi:oxalate decarboxylase/phosphoglucose isomerase-like protein (cupin superfamily)